jgi:energy-converting hydrogenase Eha subunit B
LDALLPVRKPIERTQTKMRNIKILGLAFVAMLAVSAVAATAASAGELTAESYPATLTGAKDPGAAPDVLFTTAGNISCSNPKYTATIIAGTTTVTVTPYYGETVEKQCTAIGLPATVHMNGCDYLLHLGTGASTVATVDLICPEGKEVTITANPAEHAGLTEKCTIHIKEQKGLESVNVTSLGAGSTRELTLDINISGIHYTHTAGTGLGKCTGGTGTDGKITATATVTGDTAGGAHNGLFVSSV